ncbi:hypothetical protein GQ457_12G031280 [Hibiscus cannabinus]
MTRANLRGPRLELDPEIERTQKQLKRGIRDLMNGNRNNEAILGLHHMSQKNQLHFNECMIQELCENSMVRFYAGNDQPGRIKSQQYFKVVLKQPRSQRPRNHQGRVSAQIFQPRPMNKIQEGILISTTYFSQYP